MGVLDDVFHELTPREKKILKNLERRSRVDAVLNFFGNLLLALILLSIIFGVGYVVGKEY